MEEEALTTTEGTTMNYRAILQPQTEMTIEEGKLKHVVFFVIPTLTTEELCDLLGNSTNGEIVVSVIEQKKAEPEPLPPIPQEPKKTKRWGLGGRA